MTEADALELLQAAILTTLFVSAPMVIAAMIIGVIVALLQALTQVQEMTLTFVPKILVMLGVLSLSAPFIGAKMFSFMEHAYSRIESGY